MNVYLKWHRSGIYS